MTVYQNIINDINPNVNARWVEGFMRLQYGTLSHLDHATFRSEVKLFASMMTDMPKEEMKLWEINAKSFGL